MKIFFHKMVRCVLRMLAMIAIFSFASGATAQQKAKPAPKLDSAAAINTAARQPMLAERITKSFALVGQKVLEARSRRQLDESVREFEKGLQTLQTTAPTPEIRDNYQLLEQLFDEYKGITAKPVNLENAKLLAEQNEELVWIARQIRARRSGRHRGRVTHAHAAYRQALLVS
jgi:hypothetical protein